MLLSIRLGKMWFQRKRRNCNDDLYTSGAVVFFKFSVAKNKKRARAKTRSRGRLALI